MTDTPRTRAQLLSMFADNNAGNVTPQNMRDFVMSAATPLVGGGLDPGPGVDQVASVWFNIDETAGMNVPSTPGLNATTFIPYATGTDNLYDSQGWFQFGSSYASPDWYGATVPAGSWALLPEGVYSVMAFLYWENAGATGTCAYRALDTCDNRAVTAGLDAWAWNPFYGVYASIGRYADAASMAQYGSHRQHDTAQTIRVTAATGPVAFATSCSQNSGSTRKIKGGTIDIMRISGGG